MGTSALINLCDPTPEVKPFDQRYSSSANYRDDAFSYSSPPPPPANGGATICTGYRPKKADPHYRLLRVTQSKMAEFGIIRL